MSVDNAVICEDCAFRKDAEKLGNHRIWRDRALKAEDEVQRCYKDLQELTAERDDLKAMLADAGIRNAVLDKRLDRMLEEDITPDCPPCYADQPVGCSRECKDCWRDWLEREVQA